MVGGRHINSYESSDRDMPFMRDVAGLRSALQQLAVGLAASHQRLQAAAGDIAASTLQAVRVAAVTAGDMSAITAMASVAAVADVTPCAVAGAAEAAGIVPDATSVAWILAEEFGPSATRACCIM